MQEWQNGDITTMSDSCQGAFINICVFYWASNCKMTLERLLKRFKSRSKTIQKLIKSEVIKDQNGIISISFLDQQLSELNKSESFFRAMGHKGQKAKKMKASLEPLKSDEVSYKDKDKDKDKEKDKDKINTVENEDHLKPLEVKKKDLEIFNKARKKFPGTKGGNEKEFENFKKKHKDYKKALPLLETAIEREGRHKSYLAENTPFCPPWKNFQTWINQRCWEDEFTKPESQGTGNAPKSSAQRSIDALKSFYYSGDGAKRGDIKTGDSKNNNDVFAGQGSGNRGIGSKDECLQ